MDPRGSEGVKCKALSRIRRKAPLVVTLAAKLYLHIMCTWIIHRGHRQSFAYILPLAIVTEFTSSRAFKDEKESPEQETCSTYTKRTILGKGLRDGPINILLAHFTNVWVNVGWEGMRETLLYDFALLTFFIINFLFRLRWRRRTSPFFVFSDSILLRHEVVYDVDRITRESCEKHLCLCNFLVTVKESCKWVSSRGKSQFSLLV